MKFKYILPIFAAAFVCSCGDKKDASKAIDPVVEVKLATVSSESVPQTATYTATVESDLKNNISPNMSYRIERILVDVGDQVSKGQLLVQLDASSLNQLKLQIDNQKVEFNRNGTVKADPLTYQTAEPDIFVGGDVYTGQKFVIDAIAAGKEGAISLHRWVHPGQTLTLGRDRRVYKALDKDNILLGVESLHVDHRQVPGYNEAKARTFGDERVTFTEEQIKKETARCLGCGATKVDEYMCIGCGLCTTKCAFDAIHMKKAREWQAGKFETMPIKVAEGLVKKTGKIIAKPFKR